MKKIITTLTLISLLVMPVFCLAAVGDTVTPIPDATFNSMGDLVNKIEEIGNWIFTALLAIAAIFLVVAGYFFVTAGGNPEGVNKARQMLINALIGVAVGLSAKGLIAVITSVVSN